MYLLDTDHITLLDRGGEEGERLRLKITAIALAHNATLLSRNLVDFGKIPALRVEDWTL
jgi:predicted nucleic acid-binding protein